MTHEKRLAVAIPVVIVKLPSRFVFCGTFVSLFQKCQQKVFVRYWKNLIYLLSIEFEDELGAVVCDSNCTQI